jgi:hypothetical protein
MDCKTIRLRYEDVRHDVIDCNHCGCPLFAGDKAVEINGESGYLTCSQSCADKLIEAVEREQAMAARTNAHGQNLACFINDDYTTFDGAW